MHDSSTHSSGNPTDHNHTPDNGAQRPSRKRGGRRRNRKGGGGGGPGGGGDGGHVRDSGAEYRPVPSGREDRTDPFAPGRPREHDDSPVDFDAAVGPVVISEAFDTTCTFASIGLRNSILRSLKDRGFRHPTHIQAQIIPPILAGRDMLGQAKTGTGKTAAFGLPLIHRIEDDTPAQALILVPTRELAQQVTSELNSFAWYTNVRAIAIYGGQKIDVQARRLQRNPQIIVATPGRVMDMRQRGILSFSNVRYVVLDEVDRMLDIGFRDDIRDILGSCPKDRQTVFVSATISPEIERLARKYCKPDSEKIVTSAGALTVELVKQYYLSVEAWDKRRLLAHLLTHEEPALTLVFCAMKRTVDAVVAYINKKGIDAHAIHGDMPQSHRNRVIGELRGGRLAVLVASDLASRGLDVEGITHVINYDLPEDPDQYVHRIGRTARAGREGIAWALVTPEQGPLLTQIERLINAEIPKLDYPDFTPGPVPDDVQARKDADRSRVEARRGQQSRFTAAATPVAKKAVDQTKFPGGLVPSMAPPKKLQGRVRSSRR